MNTLFSLLVFASLQLFFVKDSPDLIIRIIPSIDVQYGTIYYSFKGTDWDTIRIREADGMLQGLIKAPAAPEVIGLYCRYDNGAIDDNNGHLYLYEVKASPRMLMPFSFDALEVMLKQARKKIITRTHIDEAITLLDYIERMLEVVPFIENSPDAAQREILQIETQSLRDQLAR